METTSLEQALSNSFLFEGLEDTYLQELARRMLDVHYGPGNTLIVEGQAGHYGGMGVVVNGSLKVVHGGDQVIAHLGAGDIFGEMSLIDEQPRSASVIAEEPTDVALLSPRDFRAAIAEHPDIAMRVLYVLSKRLREARQLPTSVVDQPL
ncbi:MAG TPA: cyclic nucleotide-binding domain-containing protein [Chloroflexota bacterium]